MFVNQSPRYEILSEESLAVLDRGWRRIVSELGVEFTMPEAVELFAQAGMKTEGDNVWLDPEFVMEQVREGAVHVPGARPQPGQLGHDRRPEHGVRLGLRAAVRPRRRRPPHRHAARLPPVLPALAVVPAARLRRRHDLRAGRRAARLAPPRHGAGAGDADRQVLHGLGDVRPERDRHDPDGRDRVRRPRGDRARSGDDLADQRQLAAALRRADAGGAVRVRARRPAGAADAVPPDGRDVAGVGAGDARPSRWRRRSPGSRWCS